MNTKISAGIAAIVIAIVMGILLWSISPTEQPAQKACTMEAKLCPDGSAVGRTGPNCEFAACP